MNPLESQLHYPFDDALPAAGRRLSVADGIHWLRMPLPFALDHINLWLMRDTFGGRDGWTVVDCGISSPETRACWEQLIADHLDGLPIVRVLCTHTHPDHVGLADWLTTRFEAPLWMTLGEYSTGRIWSAVMPGADGSAAADHFARHGVDAAVVESIRNRNTRYFATLVPGMPLSFTRIRADTPITIGGRCWQVIIGTGHSPEHAALWCERDHLLISGDMVLPRISTNCSVFEMEPMADPLRWYLESLHAFERCGDDTLVLPSHGRPFRHLKVRLRQLADHHADRFDRVREACAKAPVTANDALAVIFGRTFDTHQTTFAVGESLAHLHALWYAGELDREVGTDGLVRFRLSRSRAGA